MRSLFAAGFPLFARQMFNNMTIKWAGTLVACIATILVPVPVAFLFFGPALRVKSKFAPTLPQPMMRTEPNGRSEDDEEGKI